MPPLTFVVGTSRCGSTMLSRILKEHPDVLSLNEYMFDLLDPYRVMAENVGDQLWTRVASGDGFWDLVSAPDPIHAGLASAKIPIPEYIYPSAGRFNEVTVPKICKHVLPLLSDDPDSLYDELAAEVSTWPVRSIADHCRALFAVLADIMGRRVVVERSGGSLAHVAILRQQFPEARFVLLHRNGPDAALSMSRHAMFRLGVIRAIAKESAGIPETASAKELSAAASPEFNGLIDPPFDKERFMAYPIPASIFGYSWSRITRIGVSDLRELPSNTWTSLRYEDIINTPRVSLTRLAEFLDIPTPPQWLDWASGFVDPGRAGSAARLDPAELAPLRTSCAPGARVLASLGSGLSASGLY